MAFDGLIACSRELEQKAGKGASTDLEKISFRRSRANDADLLALLVLLMSICNGYCCDKDS
eukprot:16286-Heterococcus_DN1.PRE.4